MDRTEALIGGHGSAALECHVFAGANMADLLLIMKFLYYVSL